LKSQALGRDCLKLSEEYLEQRNWAGPSDFSAWRAEAVQQVEEAVAKVQRERAPDPFEENWIALSEKHLGEGNE
jgi:TPP-dependent pyruvate/acetoin dehydrogenase alpha subunit